MKPKMPVLDFLDKILSDRKAYDTQALVNLRNCVLQTIDDLTQFIPSDRMVECMNKGCRETASDEGQEYCLFCGSPNILFYSTEKPIFGLRNIAGCNEIAYYMLNFVCTDGIQATHYEQVKIFNLALKFVGFHIRISDFKWAPKGACQALEAEYTTIGDERMPDEVRVFLNQFVKTTIVSTGSAFSNLADVEFVLLSTRKRLMLK
jgi:hypothetical protein